MLLGDANASVMVHQSLVELGGGHLRPPQELGEHWLFCRPAEGGLLPACVPGTFCSGVVRAPEAEGWSPGLAGGEKKSGLCGEGSPRGARATSNWTQAGERAAGRAARCGAVLHAGAERARARERGAGFSAGALLLAAPLQLAGPAPHSSSASRGCRVPFRPDPEASPSQAPPQLLSAGRAPPYGARSRLEPLAQRARSRGAGGGRAAPASALPAAFLLALPGGSLKEEFHA